MVHEDYMEQQVGSWTGNFFNTQILVVLVHNAAISAVC